MRHRIILGAALALLVFAGTAMASAAPGQGRPVDPLGPAAAHDAWRYEGVHVGEAHPHLKRYVWESDRPPYGPWDRIAVHRWVNEPDNGDATPGRPAPDPSKVLFVIPGTWSSATGLHPEQDNAYWFAARGYDVYSLDFRASYVPDLPYERFAPEGLAGALRSTANWTYDTFREDIKAAVELAKEISGAEQVFLAGRSRGGRQMHMYAAKYADDLKGMIGLDGGPIHRPADEPEVQASEGEFRQAMAEFRAGTSEPPMDTYLSEIVLYEESQLAAALPFVDAEVGGPLPSQADLPHGPPPDGSTIDTLAELLVYMAYFEWGEGRLTNVYTPYPGGDGEGYIDPQTVVDRLAGYLRYWPRVQDLEGQFMAGYANVPFLDYDDTEDVEVPIIHFVGELTCPGGTCLDVDRPYSTGTEDVTVVYLPGYGHLDIYAGTHATEDVDAPMLDWMNARR
jgi:pimeloyl-ACP methyl ester carboxylesterase